MRRKIVFIAVFISIFVFTTNTVLADTRGKIAGRITDSETGLPLAGVNVYVAKEQIGSVSDTDGYFNILNLPPGQHDVIASIIGYKKVTIQRVGVASDQTSTINFELESSVLQGEEVIVIAQKPLVQADRTSSKAIITEEEIKAMPTETFQELLTTKAGVTQSSSGDLHIRGGRTSEILYMVDGIPVSNPFSSGLGLSISTNMIKELSMVSGTFNAEYGKAMSGIVNLVTKDGGEKYEGDISFQFGDMYSNRTDIFDYVSNYNPLTFKRTDLSLSGPVKFLPGGSFILTGTFRDAKGWLYGKHEHNTFDFYNFIGDDWFILMSGDGERVAMNPSVSKNVMGKLTIKPWKSAKLSYHFTGADSRHQNYSYQEQPKWKYNPDGRYTYTSSNYMHALHFTHTLSNKTYYTLKASYKNADAEDYVHKLDVPYKWDEDINGNGVNDIMGYNSDGTPFDEDLNNDGILSEITVDWDFLKEYGAFIPNHTRTITIYDSIKVDLPNYVPNDGRSDVPSYHFAYGGQHTGYFISNNQTKTFKFDLTSQVTNSHQIRTGIEFNFYELYRNDIYIEMSDRTSWRPYIQSIQTAGHDQYVREPNDFSAYIQDKIEIKDIIVQAGLRYDYFHPHDKTFSNKTDPAGSDSIKVKQKSQISPRLGVSFPITDQGYIHFSYGHFFQMPPFSYLYRNPNLKKSSGVTRFGNPDLNAQKTVMYELGLQQQINVTTAIDVTIFYRNILNWLSSEYNYIDNTFRYTKYITQDYGNVRGITLSLTNRQFSGFSMNLDYTFQLAGGNASSPDAAYYDNQKIPPIESEKKQVPLDWDVRHTINATFSLRTADKFNLSLINRFSTGRPYTPTIQGQRNAEENSDRKLFVFSTDLQANKFFTIGRNRLSLNLKIYNLFDILSEKYVHTDTGRSGSSLVPTYAGQSITAHADTPGIHSLEEYLYPPTNYYNPRQILVGISWHFQGK